MSSRPSHLAAVVAALVAVTWALPAGAQYGGGRGGRRPSSSSGAPDSASRPTRDPNTINTVDVIMEKRADLGLSADQVAKVSAAKTRRDVAVDTLSARAASLKLPTDPNAWATMSDSDKVAMRERNRSRAAVIRAQRDAEARAREDALAALTPEQAARAVKIEDDMRRSAFAEARFGGASRSEPSGRGAGGGRFGGP